MLEREKVSSCRRKMKFYSTATNIRYDKDRFIFEYDNSLLLRQELPFL